MKKFFCIFIISYLFAAVCNAAINFNGCYQLYVPGSMYPSFCIDGTQEEGINGSGVRLVVFESNTDLIIGCALSSALSVSGDSLEFIVGNRKELIMSEVKPIQSRLEGTATFGKTSLKFIQIEESLSKRLLSKFYFEPKCVNLNIGEFIKLSLTNQ
jgi:hypothetical protein